MGVQTNVLLSIKPKYAHQIIAGTKKVEFRKAGFKEDIAKVFIYSSYPEQKLIGYFTIKDIIKDKPSALWKKFNEVGGIKRKDFFEYYTDKELGYSIVIDRVKKFRNPKNPNDVFVNFKAPQSFCYLDESNIQSLKD